MGQKHLKNNAILKQRGVLGRSSSDDNVETDVETVKVDQRQLKVKKADINEKVAFDPENDEV